MPLRDRASQESAASGGGGGRRATVAGPGRTGGHSAVAAQGGEARPGPWRSNGARDWPGACLRSLVGKEPEVKNWGKTGFVFNVGCEGKRY